MKIYVASSWRNYEQPEVVRVLREEGHEVYDFKNPAPGNNGFRWSEISPDWTDWTVQQYIDALSHPVAEAGFASDWNAMKWAEACVLVMPCGRSAHIEAGYFVGAKKPLYILQPGKAEPELMYKMATAICVSIDDVLVRMAEQTCCTKTGPTLKAAERELIEGTFSRFNGNREQTAKSLQMGVRTLSGKLRQYGYPPRGKPGSNVATLDLIASEEHRPPLVQGDIG